MGKGDSWDCWRRRGKEAAWHTTAERKYNANAADNNPEEMLFEIAFN
jgi:hypothetical protein